MSLIPDISGGAGGITGGDSTSGDIQSSNSLTFGNIQRNTLGSSKMLLLAAAGAVALLILKKG